MNFFNYIIWNVNPEVLPFVDWIKVRWYGVLFALGFIISQQIMYWIFKKEGKSTKDVDSLTIFMIVATVIGARLGHVLFYEPAKYFQDPISILKTWEGGLASHGATIGVLVGIFLYVNYFVDINLLKFRFIWKKRKRPGQSFLWVVDRIVICGAIIGALIRMGNFVNSEIIGVPTHSSSGVLFAYDVVSGMERFNYIDEVQIEKSSDTTSNVNNYQPVKMYINFSSDVKTSKVAEKLVKTNIKAILTDPYISEHIYEPMDHTISYTILDDKPNQPVAVINTLAIVRHPAQLYESISSFLIFVLLLILWNRKKEKTPEGYLFGVFFVVLFGLRFLYEFIKEAQVDFEESMTLNMGQILSIPLIIIGILILLNLKKLQPKNKESKK
jgi:prolipoprotein diacylglyceryl transferase